VGFGADKQTFKRVYGLYQETSKRSIYLKCIIKYFPPEIVGNVVGALTQTINDDFAQGSRDRLVCLREMGL